MRFFELYTAVPPLLLCQQPIFFGYDGFKLYILDIGLIIFVICKMRKHVIIKP